METGTDGTAGQEDTRCAECSTTLWANQDREVTDGGTFCRTCFDNLTAQVQQAVAAQGTEINYGMAVIGGLAGAAIGVVAWWGFTILTHISFGLVAVVIGLTTAKGICMLAGGKRHVNLQIMAVGISVAAFFYASYLVNRSLVLAAYAEEAQQVVLPLIPSVDLFLQVIGLHFGIMDLVFLAIVGYEAWKIPAPYRLAR